MRTGVCISSVCGVVLGGCAGPLLPERAPERIVIGTQGEEPVVIPSHWCGAYVILDVEVNGVGPFSMLLDTGSDATVLDSALASRFPDAVVDRAEVVRGAEGEEFDIAQQLRVESMRAGGVELGGFEAAMLDLGAIGDALGSPIDGVLGFRSFYGVLLTVDYPGEEVSVSLGTLSDDGFDNVMPMRGLRSPSVPIEIEGVTLNALIDTAGTPAMTLDDWSMFSVATRPVPIGTSVSIGGINVLKRGRLASDMKCGVHTFERPLFSPTTGGVKLGTDMLEPFSITFDQRARLVRFNRPGIVADPIGFPSQRGLGVGFDRRSDAWIVMRVFDRNTHLRVDDRVVAIEGRLVSSLGCGVYHEMMETLAMCTVAVERDMETIEIRVPVVQMVP